MRGEYWMEILQKKGVEAEFLPIKAPFWKNQRGNGMVRLSGQNIDEIRIRTRLLGGGAQGGNARYETNFKIYLDRPLQAVIKKAVTAKTRPIWQKKSMGVSWGKITDVEWIGGSITQALNQDTNLRMMILSVVQDETEIRIKPEGKSIVNIRKQEPEGRLSGSVDEFEAFDKIAKQVREIATTY